MVELGRFSPAFGSMANSAFRSEPTLMLVILRVTGIAILGSGLQVGEVARIDMALRTSRQRMDANQMERNFIMVKV